MSLTGNTSVHPIRVFPGHFYCMRGPSLVELTGDGNRPKKPCVLSTGETMVTIGESTAVCIVVNNLTWVVMEDESRKYSQVLITPKADEFSRFTVSGSWNSSTNSLDPIVTTFGTEVGVHVESLGKYSFQKAFRLKSENKTFPLHTAIITVHKGEVTGISWDDGCHFCSSSDCQENTYDYSGELAEESGPDCYWPDESCNETIDSLIEDAADTYQKTIEPADS